MQHTVREIASAELPTPAPAPEPQQPCTDCDSCLHRRVLDKVMERLPEVRDLLEAMEAEDFILRNLGGR